MLGDFYPVGGNVAARRVGLVKARKAAGYTQEQLAEQAHVDRSTVIRWEAGGTAPLPYLRPKVARLLRVTSAELEELLAEQPADATLSAEPSVPEFRVPLDSGEGCAWQELARQAGAAVELKAQLDFDIAADGWVRLTGRHELLNLSDQPISRLTRELWFEHTEGPLRVDPLHTGAHRIAIQRIHETYNLAKFACLVSPAIQPGESAIVGYTCTGGQFVSDHYWQQVIVRFTRRLSIQTRHRGTQLRQCTATAEHVDGAQKLIADSLQWDDSDGDTTIRLVCEYLRPNQIITLRWEVGRADS
jgi:transcriptional regulator with XRE-family HTH domain